MISKRSQEGYLLIDHRNSPGLATDHGLPPCMGQGMFEAPTVTCSHCQRVVIINPARTRSRPYCPKCDHYICDACETVRVASGGECTPFLKIIEQAQERALKEQDHG